MDTPVSVCSWEELRSGAETTLMFAAPRGLQHVLNVEYPAKAPRRSVKAVDQLEIRDCLWNRGRTRVRSMDHSIFSSKRDTGYLLDISTAPQAI